MPEKTRQRLLAEGERMFCLQGFNATGIQQIADSAGMPKGSFYNHFPSKEAFAVAVIDYHWHGERYQPGLQQLRENGRHAGHIDARTRLQQYFLSEARLHQAQQYQRGCLFTSFATEMADHSEMIRLHLLDTFNAWCVVLDQCLIDGQRNGEWRNTVAPPILSRMIIQAWQGAIIRAQLERSHHAFDEFMTLVFEHLLQ